MKARLVILISLFSWNNFVNAQKRCGTGDNYQSIIKYYPQLEKRYGVANFAAEIANPLGNTELKIEVPVVVHIVWKRQEEKISLERIKEQMQIINEDFNGTNSDIANVPQEFKNLIAENTNISFRLDTVTYTKTIQDGFGLKINVTDSILQKNQKIKFSSYGGMDAFPCTQYLNIWVGNIYDAHVDYDPLCGFGTYPGGPDQFDGVVMNYKCFGKPGIYNNYNKGRNLTHEIGHWLNLQHLWGNGNSNECSDDGIDDTPPQSGWNEGCPNYPHSKKSTCGNAQYGDIFMDFMDYVDDYCMCMFTVGQKTRMRSTFTDYEQRRALIKPANIFNNPDVGFVSDMIIDKPDVIDIFSDKENKSTYLSWDKALVINQNKISYRVLIREVGKDKWELEKPLIDNQIEIKGLKYLGLYELVIKTYINGNVKNSSAPFVFINENGLQIKNDKLQIKSLGNF